MKTSAHTTLYILCLHIAYVQAIKIHSGFWICF